MTTLSNQLIHSIHTYVLSVRYVAGITIRHSSKGEPNLVFFFLWFTVDWEYRQSEKSHKHEYIQSQNEIKYNKGKEQPALGAKFPK